MEYYYPFSFVNPVEDKISAKKSSILDGYSDFDTSFFESDDAKLVPSEQEIKVAEEVKKTEKKASVRKKKDSDGVVLATPAQAQIQDDTNVPYARSYDETNAMLRQAIIQADVMTSEIKSDLDKIRGSSTMKSKYTYITNLTSAEVGLIGSKIQAIREINNSITQAHNLELKRAKDIKDAQRDQQNDDARMMDLYNAFINSPVGMYQNSLNMPTIPDMMLGTNGMNPTVQGVSMNPGSLDAQTQLTPEQMRMRMEANPNIEEVLMYEPSTGRRWFEVVDNTTGQPVPNFPKSDEFLLADCTLDLRTSTARNRNIDKVWRLVNIEGGTVNEY